MATALPLQGTFQSVRRWQDFAVMRSLLVSNGKILAESFPNQSSVARYWSKASPNNHPGHDFHFMYPKRELGRKYRPFVATYRRYVSKMSWFWQDLRAVHPKSPANHCLRIHRVQILPGRAPFPVRGAQIMHSAHFLPSPPPNSANASTRSLELKRSARNLSAAR